MHWIGTALLEFVVGSVCYFFIVGILYLPAFAAGCVLLAFIKPRKLDNYLNRVWSLFGFLVVLLLVGDCYAWLWGEFVFGRFYLSTNYCGTDFAPYWPITHALLDAPMGTESHGLIGVTLTQLNLIWLLFALATWTSTFAVHRLIFRYERRGLTAASPEELSAGTAAG